MIKLKLRRNLLYLFVYYITWTFKLFFERILDYSKYIDLYLTVIGKIFGGLITYLYQYQSLKRDKQIKYFGINLIHNKGKTKIKDSKTKIGILLFFAFTFYVFRFITVYQFETLMNTSPSIESRLSSIQTISSSLICTYALGFEMKKHHKYSLIIISIFLVLTFFVDIIFKSKNINFIKYLYFDLFILYYYTCETFNNCIEKYLVDINYINPFLILTLEGIFEFILTSIYIGVFNKKFLNGLKIFINANGTKKLLRILPLIGYILISTISNVYKIYCNVIYSPMARSLINYLLTPVFIIYTFFINLDFNRNVLYLVISIILSVVISFFGCVYNEYIILFCCELEKETKDSIAERAKSVENFPESIICELTNQNNRDSELDNNID